MITAPNPQKPTPAQPNQQQPAPNTGAQAAINNNQNNAAGQNTPQQPNQMKDEELLNLLKQKMEDQKFKEMLGQLLNPQQPNAANKPA
jgi:hypothetical protein